MSSHSYWITSSAAFMTIWMAASSACACEGFGYLSQDFACCRVTMFVTAYPSSLGANLVPVRIERLGGHVADVLGRDQPARVVVLGLGPRPSGLGALEGAVPVRGLAELVDDEVVRFLLGDCHFCLPPLASEDEQGRPR